MDLLKKNKIIIILVLLVIIIGMLLILNYFRKNLKIENVKTISNNLTSEIEKNDYNSKLSECQFKSFKPTFKLSEDSIYCDYDFLMDMEYDNKIYHRKIDNYQDYLNTKTRWKDILDMDEKDFESKFMVITAIENIDMAGLKVDNIETDEDTLYISLIKDESIVDTDKTCISYILPRSLERENIKCIRNFSDAEKDFDTEMKIAKLPEDLTSFTTFQYRTKEHREFVAKQNTSNSKSRVIEPEWNDMLSDNFVINNEMIDIDLNSWKSLGNGYYSLSITKYSDYVKLMNYYNLKKLNWQDFQYIYSVIVINTSPNKILKSKLNNENKLLIYSEENANVDDNAKYQGISIILPNYRINQSDFINIEN